MPYVSVFGVEHYYEWVCGAGDQPSGKPVMVFLHGWGGSLRYWQSTAQAIAAEFDCLLYDLRGFGRSRGVASLPEAVPPYEESDRYALESYAHDLAGLLDQMSLDRVYLNAHSTGASIATLFVNRYPERVHRAILTCSGIFEYDERAFKAFHKFGGYVVKFRPPWLARLPFANRLFMARFLRRSLPDAISQAFLEDFIQADYDAALNTIYTAVSERAALEMPREFAAIAVPTLLVAGEYDIIIPAEMGRQAAQLSDRVELAVIPETAHFPMLEDPETYLQRVRSFLVAEQPATPSSN
jgi:pimeloyl-ACP methyl ester carboxylesterase